MLDRTKQPKLTLVGAGPGDEELITLKGVKALQQADVVLYDALVNKALLKQAPSGCMKVYVGKRAGKHSFTQAEINQLIVSYAFLSGHVVRLKGGDPFVFGRGAEEIAYAQDHGLATAVVPGISSALAVPALQNISLTKRGVSRSFWVVTATTRCGGLSKDLHLAAQSSATIVILMGMRKLGQIAQLFTQFRGAQEPIAVIQNGSRSNEKVATGTLATIGHLAKKQALGTPAVIVIGQVVKENLTGLQKEIIHRKLLSSNLKTMI
ncbi:MAG TPA: uroporphyrinogen-III C-methyltransferase [Microscillaceae bacterium]|nr:uroporphyrinogen-III C-methyltransferase [Microscillaceae bacterium]